MRENAKRIANRVERFIDGSLDASGREELASLLEGDPAARRFFLEQLDLSNLVSELYQARDFTIEMVDKLVASRDDNPPQEAPGGSGSLGRKSSPPSTRRFARGRWQKKPGLVRVAAVVAAGLLVGVSLIIMLHKPATGSRPESKEARLIQQRQDDEARQAEREEVRRRAVQEIARLEADRERAEQELSRVELEKRKAEEAQRLARQELQKEAQRRAEDELARLEAQRRQAEEELKKARAEKRKAEEDLARTPPPTPAPPVRPETRPVAATIERAEGDVRVISDGNRTPAKAGQGISEGQGLEAAGPKSCAVIQFPDGTRLELRADACMAEVLNGEAPSGGKGGRGKRVSVARGMILADVTRQPAEQPMVFSTPYAEAHVLGTSLKLEVGPDDKAGTWLEVLEGRVRLTRSLDRKAVEVTAGHYAAAARGVDLASKSAPLNMLADPGFERNGAGWKQKGNQELSAAVFGTPDIAHKIVPAPVHRGGGAAMITGEGIWKLCQGIPVEPGALYEVEGWARTREAVKAEISLVWLDRTGDWNQAIRTDAVGTWNGTQDWTRHWARFRAPANAKFAWIFLSAEAERASGAGAWFDGLGVWRLPKDR